MTGPGSGSGSDGGTGSGSGRGIGIRPRQVRLWSGRQLSVHAIGYPGTAAPKRRRSARRRCFVHRPRRNTGLNPPGEGGEMPPRGVKKGTKRARQYEHIKESLRERGSSEDEAEEIAARTVNKERARHGEAREPSRLSQRGHLLRPTGRSPLTPALAPRAHEGPAVRRSQVDGHQGPVDDEQGAARARGFAQALVAGPQPEEKR